MTNKERPRPASSALVNPVEELIGILTASIDDLIGLVNSCVNAMIGANRKLVFAVDGGGISQEDLEARVQSLRSEVRDACRELKIERAVRGLERRKQADALNPQAKQWAASHFENADQEPVDKAMLALEIIDAETYEVEDLWSDWLEKRKSDGHAPVSTRFRIRSDPVKRVIALGTQSVTELSKGCAYARGALQASTMQMQHEDALSPLQIEILSVLDAQKTHDSDKRLTAKLIALARPGKDEWEIDSVRRACNRLVKLRLLHSKKGSGGGYWLTQAGKKRAAAVNK